MFKNEIKNKILVALTEAEISDFSDNVSLSIISDVPNTDIEYAKKVNVSFNIDIEEKKWGINGISLSFKKPIEIPYTLLRYSKDSDEEKREEKKLIFDPTKIKHIDWTPGKTMMLLNIDIYLKENGEVNYNRSSIDAQYISPEE